MCVKFHTFLTACTKRAHELLRTQYNAITVKMLLNIICLNASNLQELPEYVPHLYAFANYSKLMESQFNTMRHSIS